MERIDLNEYEKEFVKEFSRFVNGGLSSPKRVGDELANDHRYLVQEKFKVLLGFMESLALNWHKGFYDARNEWACKLAAKMIDGLIQQDLYYPSSNYKF